MAEGGQGDVVAKAVELMRADLARPLEMRRVAQDLHYSQFHFQRAFRRGAGITPGQFLAALRIARAKELLASTVLPIYQVALDVGYQSQGTFNTQFSRHVGLSPGRFRSLVDQVSGLTLENVVGGPIEPTAGVPGDVVTAPGCEPFTESVTVVGVFDAAIPRGQPSAFSLTTSDQRRAQLPAVQAPALAASYPAGTLLTGILLDTAPILIGQATPLPPIRAEVQLRTRRATDPPVLTAVPVLYLSR